jgi:hypothetical protein
MTKSVLVLFGIMAFVVLFGCTTAGLTNQVVQQGNAIPETSAKSAWKLAEPWAITDWVGKNDGTIILVVQNNSSNSLDLKNISLSGSITQIQKTSLPPGSRTTVNITNLSACANGKYLVSKDTIKISYAKSGTSEEQIETGASDILGTC